jgi:Pyruvate/2-oxoacid:ferredoxin oxidoreductase gamma subunit
MRQSAKFLRDGGVLLQNEKLVPVVGHYRSKKGFIRGDDYQDLMPPCVGTLYSTNASQLALAAGNPRAENMALWGVAVGLGLLPVSPDICRSMIDRFMSGVSAQFSHDAFTAGLNRAQSGAVVPAHPRQTGSENGGALASEPADAGRASGEETRGG